MTTENPGEGRRECSAVLSCGVLLVRNGRGKRRCRRVAVLSSARPFTPEAHFLCLNIAVSRSKHHRREAQRPETFRRVEILTKRGSSRPGQGHRPAQDEAGRLRSAECGWGERCWRRSDFP